MTSGPPAWLADYGGTPAAIDRFRSYVSNETVARVYEAWRQMKSEPVPFSLWRWHKVAASVGGEDSRDWKTLYGQLRGHMDGGGILVVIGPSRTGKTRLLERLMLHRIIDNSRSGLERDAPVSSGDVPSGLFAIDETQAHDRRDMVRVVSDMTGGNRGFAMVFQRPESFRDYGIGAHLAMQSVQFLELVG